MSEAIHPRHRALIGIGLATNWTSETDLLMSKNCLNPRKKNIYANHEPVSDALSQGFTDFNSPRRPQKNLLEKN